MEQDWKNCAGYNLLLETRKWIDGIEKKVEKMRKERIDDVNEVKNLQIQLGEIITRLDMTIQGQEKILQGLVDENKEIKQSVKTLDKELHNGLIAKKAQEWFYRSIGKWVIGIAIANITTLIALIISHI